MSFRPTKQPINLLDYPSEAPLVHVDRSSLCLGPVKQEACNVNLPMGDDIEFYKGLTNWGKDKLRDARTRFGGPWTSMKEYIKKGSTDDIANLVEKKDFDLLKTHATKKGPDVRAVDYAEQLYETDEYKKKMPEYIRTKILKYLDKKTNEQMRGSSMRA